MAQVEPVSGNRAAQLTYRFRGYLVALGSMAIVVLARRSFLDAFFDSSLPLRLFIVPVIASAWIGGLMPGLFATVLGAFVSHWVFGEGPDESIDWPQIATYIGIGSGLSIFMETLHAARRRLEERQTQLEHEIVERQKAQAAERLQRDRLTSEMEQRMMAESAVREREERIRMAVESANIGTWDLNVATGQRQWSDRSKAMFGLSPDEDVSKFDFVELLHPDDREHVRQAIQQALDPQGPGRYEVEYRALWSDGTLRWIVARGQAFFQGEGKARRATRFIGTAFDFSARKELENALQDADRRKDEFLAILAHELRNPLAPINYALQLWPIVENDKAQVSDLRNMMGRQVEQITRLIDDLMDVSRITRGKIELRKQETDICTIVRAAIESVQPLVESCGHRLTVTLPNEPFMISGDVARLVQVFANILNNATKYTSRGGVIWISVQTDGENVSVSMRDNGPGIPPHMLKDIFEMFRQVDGTISRAHGGLGIGLTLVKQLVELHGGTVEARSEGPGKGAEFIVTLPGLAPVPTVERSTGPQYHLHQLNALPSRRLLVVDDVEASAKTLAMMLRAMGQEVHALHDGPRAIEWITANKPDAVFLDIAMPEMNGYEVARRLRANHSSESLILIALTGYSQEEDRRNAFEAGFNYHLVKPVGLDSLEQVLRAVPANGYAPAATTPAESPDSSVENSHHANGGPANGSSEGSNPQTASADAPRA